MSERALAVGTVPDDGELMRVLARLAKSFGAGELTGIVARRPNAGGGTFPTEVVTCLFRGGSTRDLFCKYSSGLSHTVYGHRGGVDYEARVYAAVLDSSPVRTVGFLGAHRGVAGTWIVLDYLSDPVRVASSADPDAMPAAARWAGRFHTAHDRSPPAFLTRYDASYYRGWMARTQQFAVEVLGERSWIDELAGRFDTVVEVLRSARQTVVHGEYYTRNILVRDGTVYPVDWESAAVAPGEIDLAMLAEGWPPDVAESFERAYANARWPLGAPGEFEMVLQCARVYVLLRWLGDRPDWTIASQYRFGELRAVCERLGLIERGSPP